MQTIALVCCYFGKFPNYFNLYLRSCAANPGVRWLIFTDQAPEGVPENVTIIPTSLAAVHRLCRETIDPDIILPQPYKICDYKPLYGTIFADYLKDYEFWGYCDFDMIFGDLGAFFTPELLAKYDKILTCGHLSVYRNTPEVNARFRCPGAKYPLREVLTHDKIYAFDEWHGIFGIYRANGFPMYDEVPYAALTGSRKRFTMHRRTSSRYKNPPPDYPHQVFFWENGKLQRAYLDAGGQVRCDSFLYIHFFRRRFPDPPECDAFYCTPSGFVPKTPGELPSPREIRKLNPYYGRLYEWIESKIRRKMMKHEDHRRFVRRRDWKPAGN